MVARAQRQQYFSPGHGNSYTGVKYFLHLYIDAWQAETMQNWLRLNEVVPERGPAHAGVGLQCRA